MVRGGWGVEGRFGRGVHTVRGRRVEREGGRCGDGRAEVSACGGE